MARHWRLIGGLAGAGALLAQPPAGVTQIPAPPVIVVGDGKTAIGTSLILTIPCHARTSLTFVSHGLKTPEGTWLGTANIAGPATSVSCEPDTYITVPLSMTGLTKAGPYNGEVELREPSTPVGKGIVIPLQVELRGKPVLLFPSTALTAVHCLQKATCWLAKQVTSPSQFIQVSNRDGSEAADVDSVNVWLRISADRAVDRQLVPGAPIGRGQTVQLDPDIPSDQVVAGHYEGHVRVNLRNGDFFTSPLTLDVRDGPLVVIVLLALGIVFGRVLQAINSPTQLAQQRLVTALAAVRSSAASISNPSVRLLIDKMIADLRQAASAMTASDTDTSQHIQDLGTIVIIESNLEWIELNLTQIGEADRGEVKQSVDTARASLLEGDAVSADMERKKAQGILLGHLQTANLVPKSFSAQNMQFDAVPNPPRQPRWHVRFASFVAGMPQHAQHGKHSFLQACMFSALLAGLVVIGLFTLYAKNPTFGANLLFDYFGIVAWALSADVAQRTLQGIQLPK